MLWTCLLQLAFTILLIFLVGWRRHFSSKWTFRTCFLFWSHDKTYSYPVNWIKRKILSLSNHIFLCLLLLWNWKKKDQNTSALQYKKCFPKKLFKVGLYAIIFSAKCSLRESSFNMTRGGGDEDIKGGLRKFLDTRRGVLKKLLR